MTPHTLVSRVVVACTVLTCTVVAMPAATAQGRFRAIGNDNIAAAQPLQVVTVRDDAQDVCYLVFLFQPERSAAGRPDAERVDIAGAITSRDRRLAELSDAYEKAFLTPAPVIPPLNLLRFEWEGWKVQSEYERAVRERELTRLELALERIAAMPAMTVSGPVSCAARARTPSGPDHHR
jgi:hypothetical protein